MTLRHKCAALWLVCLLQLTGCGGAVPEPERVTVTPENFNTVQVTWDAVEGASGYRVFKKTGQSADYHYVCDVTQNCYRDRELDCGQNYCYKIKTLMDNRLSEGTESEPVFLAASPSISRIRFLDETHLEVHWEDTGAEKYRLYGASASGEWTLAGETSGTDFVLEDVSGFTQLSLSALCAAAEGEYETLRCEPEPLLASGGITAVTRLDADTAVVQYEAVPGAGQYRVYRCETEAGTYELTGTSYDTVYYDENTAGKAYFYQVQPVSDTVEGPLSAAVPLGTHAKEVFGVAVFMYHEFVTQEDLDAGVAFDEYAVWAEEFEQDLQYLQENGYRTITSAELADFLHGRGTLPDKAVMLTIDDGKLGVYKHAYPLLQKYGMRAVLSVVGEQIDAADQNPQARASDPAPYCTWSEIQEMSDSGVVEIVSHTYSRHRYQNGNHKGADLAAGETEDDFYQLASRDYTQMDQKLREVTGKGTITLCYPYSVRSEASDRVWMRCGYEILFCGNQDDIRRSEVNYYVQDAGVNYYSARTRRVVRMTGTSLQTYLQGLGFQES